MKIVKYGIGQKPHVNIKFQCSYCQTKFVADEFEYAILLKSAYCDNQYIPDDTSASSDIKNITDEANLLEMLQYTPVAECTCPICHQVIHKELRRSDDPDINKIVQGISMAVMSTTAIILMCIAQHMTDNDKFSIAFLPIILAIFVYCGTFADDY